MYQSFTELLEAAGPCGSCGKPLGYDFIESEQQVILDAMNRIPERLRRLIIEAPKVCEPCERMGHERQQELIKKRKVQAHIEDAYGRGFLPEQAREACFNRSRVAIEDRNLEAWQWARNWTRNKPNAWVMGAEGTGKTFWARYVLNTALESLLSVAETRGIDINRTAGRYSAEESVKRWCAVDLLLIDDIDKAGWDKAGFESLWYILDRRWDAKRRTIITSNVKPEHMREVWRPLCEDNPSILGTLFARLIPMDRIELTGASIRREQQQELSEGAA
jgi:DNA replication protein DnaC